MGYFIIKFDLDKAYDNISRWFMKEVLHEVCIPGKMRDLIMEAKQKFQ